MSSRDQQDEPRYKRPWCDCAACESRDRGISVARCNWDMAEGFSEGMRVATEQIVAWLRDKGATMDERTDDYCHDGWLLKLWADAIEAGAHSE